MSHITPSGGGHMLPSRDEFIISPDGRWRQPNPMRALVSVCSRGAPVPFPAFTGERVYMQPFIKTDGEVLLPSSLSRWVPTVTAMLRQIESASRMFLMIDQAEVTPGKSHRRPGPHIDGNWRESKGGTFDPAELLILASDVEGCVAYIGAYDSTLVGPGGDCSAMDVSGFNRERMAAGYAYVGTVATIHESLPIAHACKRTLVRINVPV